MKGRRFGDRQSGVAWPGVRVRWDAVTEYRAGIVRASIEFERPDRGWFDIRRVPDCDRQPPQNVRVKLTSLD